MSVGVLGYEIVLRHVLHATVEHDHQRQEVAPDGAEHNVGHVLVVRMHEIHCAARAGRLVANTRPAHQRSESPEQRVDPYEQDHERSDLVLRGINFKINEIFI